MAITSSVQLLKKKVTLAEMKPMKMRQKGFTLEKTEEKKILPAREKLNTRDPMGMYIVPQGGKPLTCLEIPLPGPADYTPKADLTKGSLPQYSIVGRPKTPLVNKKSPGPADYNTSGNLKWKRRSVTLKGRGRSCFEDEVAKSNGDVGSIKVDNLGVGTGGPKYSVGVKRSKIFTGPPNSLVQPQDYSAFDTPGPNYRPNSAYWGRGPKKSFGAGRDDIDLLDSRISYPGPGDYEVYTPTVGPSYSFGRKLPPPPSVLEGLPKDGPAPNAYDIKTTIGTGPASSVRGRWEESVKGQEMPSPSNYNPLEAEQKRNKKMGKTMSYRWFDTEERHVNPGPTDYNAKPEIVMRNSPKYTLAKRTKPSYPTSMCYVTSKETPGPGSYETEADFSKNDAPAFSFGHKDTNKSKEQGPAPNVYKVEENPIPGARRSPAFSMAKRLETKQSNNPGPGAYTIMPLESTTPKYTMSGRRNKAKHQFSTPAPNAYGTCETPAKKGHVTLKSRASPNVYSGFQTNKFDDRVELILV